MYSHINVHKGKMGYCIQTQHTWNANGYLSSVSYSKVKTLLIP